MNEKEMDQGKMQYETPFLTQYGAVPEISASGTGRRTEDMQPSDSADGGGKKERSKP